MPSTSTKAPDGPDEGELEYGRDRTIMMMMIVTAMMMMMMTVMIVAEKKGCIAGRRRDTECDRRYMARRSGYGTHKICMAPTKKIYSMHQKHIWHAGLDMATPQVDIWHAQKRYRVFFLHWATPRKLKYGKPSLGESMLM